LKRYASYILPILLLTGIIILGYRKIVFHHEIWDNSYINIDIITIGFYTLWILYELKISQNDIKQEIIISDYGTREFYGFSHALTILSALWFNPIWNKPGIFHLIGFFIFIFGIIFRIWSVQTLGKYYSHVVRKIDGHKIIETGPYQFLRHPAYFGMITAHIGITIFYFNYVTFLILLFLLIPSIIVRIKIEEKTLINIEGYEKFSKNKKRIIPYVW
jgi:protein-S-isoprenylcysteine O-methyltransferase Ste14